MACTPSLARGYINASLPSHDHFSFDPHGWWHIASCRSCLEELPQKLDDPDSLRIQYEIAVLQYKQNLVELGLHQVDVIRRRRKRRGRRRFWVRPWIGRRRQFGLYDQLLMELRNEDQASFKNFMRMPPEMFDELLTRVGPGITKQNTHYREALDPGLKLALTLRHLASGTKYHSMSYGWRVPHNTISLLIPKVCQAIIDEYEDEVIKCPTTPEEWRAISDKFAKRWNFPHTCGALDGKHVFNLQWFRPEKASAVLGVCVTCIVGACGSVSVYLQHCDLWAKFRVQELKNKIKYKIKNSYNVGWTWMMKMCRVKATHYK